MADLREAAQYTVRPPYVKSFMSQVPGLSAAPMSIPPAHLTSTLSAAPKSTLSAHPANKDAHLPVTASGNKILHIQACLWRPEESSHCQGQFSTLARGVSFGGGQTVGSKEYLQYTSERGSTSGHSVATMRSGDLQALETLLHKWLRDIEFKFPNSIILPQFQLWTNNGGGSLTFMHQESITNLISIQAQFLAFTPVDIHQWSAGSQRLQDKRLRFWCQKSSWLLGIKIEHDGAKHSLSISQRQYWHCLHCWEKVGRGNPPPPSLRMGTMLAAKATSGYVIKMDTDTKFHSTKCGLDVSAVSWLRSDNLSAVCVAENPKDHGSMKHLDLVLLLAVG
ncbi:hypothetical protein GY45DRAFT_1341021 [Cubamyces sp. BRFM 1775]|nr:hypothetical protein GY45DRAFT_1341021 [Cubamyces sp. BRFM 1775]